jgi:hypothetical protein
VKQLASSMLSMLFLVLFSKLQQLRYFLFHSAVIDSKISNEQPSCHLKKKIKIISIFFLLLFSYVGALFLPFSSSFSRARSSLSPPNSAEMIHSFQRSSNFHHVSFADSDDPRSIENFYFIHSKPLIEFEASLNSARAMPFFDTICSQCGGPTSSDLRYFLFSSSNCSSSLRPRLLFAGQDSILFYFRVNLFSHTRAKAIMAKASKFPTDPLWMQFKGTTSASSQIHVQLITQFLAHCAINLCSQTDNYIFGPQEFRKYPDVFVQLISPYMCAQLAHWYFFFRHHVLKESMSLILFNTSCTYFNFYAPSSHQYALRFHGLVGHHSQFNAIQVLGGSMSCIMQITFDADCKNIFDISSTPSSLILKFASHQKTFILSNCKCFQLYTLVTTWARLRFQVKFITPRAWDSIEIGIKVSASITPNFICRQYLQRDDYLTFEITACHLLRSFNLYFLLPGSSLSTIICSRAIREDFHFQYSVFDFHCNIISQGVIYFLNFNSQSAKSLNSVDSSQHARQYFFSTERKLFNNAYLFQPSEAMNAQVVNLPRVLSAVPNDGFIRRCNSFSFNEASGVALWGASHFMVGQHLLGDHTVYLMCNLYMSLSRSSHRNTLGQGQALNLLAPAEVLEPSHARTTQDQALKVFILVAFTEHSQAYSFIFSVIVEDEVQISKIFFSEKFTDNEDGQINSAHLINMTTCFLREAISHQLRFRLMFYLSPAQPMRSNLLPSSSAGASVFSPTFSPVQPTIHYMLLNRLAGGKNMSTACLSIAQLIQILLIRLAGVLLSRTTRSPWAQISWCTVSSHQNSAGDCPSRPHSVRSLNYLHTVNFPSTTRDIGAELACTTDGKYSITNSNRVSKCYLQMIARHTF